jgi:hypothetical protein
MGPTDRQETASASTKQNPIIRFIGSGVQIKGLARDESEKTKSANRAEGLLPSFSHFFLAPLLPWHSFVTRIQRFS